MGLVRQAQRGQRDARDADAKFLQRSAAGDGLRQALGQFIEFVVHNFPLLCVWFFGLQLCVLPAATGNWLWDYKKCEELLDMDR